MSVKVQLIKPHTHAGIQYVAGDVIEVSEPDARFLAEHQLIQQGNKKTRWLKAVADATDEESQP